ncbi:sigma-54-dependent transcriptional regulator [Roseovarius nitratireducens]|uniref:sigma-54-dependent transcriptional regulator n=1 Tax=Roseovarius nitratireducens TaxID=2044597 RepID=UPI000CE20938|nr:sigma 54-interacting transcriptional regulator [Roseovarius nitratireducens]
MLDGRRIVLVEDDEIMGGSLLQRLELEGAQVLWLKQMHRALGAIRTPQRGIDAVICDIALPDGTGEDLFITLCRTTTPPPFLFITGQGGIEQAVRLIKSGAADYITKPFDMSVFLDRLAQLLAPGETQEFPPILGVSGAAQRVEALIVRAAENAGPVLIRGGPGLGKDLVARRIHELSERRAAPFISVNLAREGDPEAALFGQDGAFRRLGEGTLFVNAISRLPLPLQRRLGEEIEQGIEGRLVTACGTDLEALVQQGAFDTELHYGMARMEIPIPPLGTRPEDAVWLLEQLFQRLAPAKAPDVTGIGALCLEAARDHDWPGGGREVRARLVRGLSLARGTLLQPADLFPERQAGEDGIKSLAEVREAAERAQIIAALERSGGQVGAAARMLGIARTTLWEKMQRYGLS